MVQSLQKKLGKRVRQIRKSRGWTQEKFGEISGLDHKYLGAIERGEKNLTLENVEKIAKGFSIEPFQLFLFTLSKGEIQPNTEIAKEKIHDLIEQSDHKTRSLILKISQDVASWGED